MATDSDAYPVVTWVDVLHAAGVQALPAYGSAWQTVADVSARLCFTAPEWARFERRARFVRWLVQTGRLNDGSEEVPATTA